MNSGDLKTRTRDFAVRVIALSQYLEKKKSCSPKAIAAQIVRCGTSIGANYRAACLAKSPRDFINKMKICEEETDETLYWLDLILQSNILSYSRLTELIDEANQLKAIIIASIKTSRKSLQNNL